MATGVHHGLKRLAKLYAMVERVRSLQVAAAAGAVMEVEQAAAHLDAARRGELGAGRAALAKGSRMELCAVERTEGSHHATQAVLAKLAVERRSAHQAAVEEHRASRMELRQVEGVVERVRERAKVEEERRGQAVSDDRFLSRQAWLRAKASSLGASGEETA